MVEILTASMQGTCEDCMGSCVESPDTVTDVQDVANLCYFFPAPPFFPSGKQEVNKQKDKPVGSK